MNTVLRCAQLAFACLLAAGSLAVGQTDDVFVRSSFGIRGGYPFSMGTWDEVPYRSGVTLFGGTFVFGADVEVRLSDRMTLAIDFGYHPLDGSDWEAYARTAGDTLAINASFVSFALLLRPHFIADGTNVFRMEIGPAVLLPSADETFNGRRYTYDFFGSAKLGGQGGIEYLRMVDEWIAVSVKAAIIIAPSGISYAGGESRSLVVLPVTAGVRFCF